MRLLSLGSSPPACSATLSLFAAKCLGGRGLIHQTRWPRKGTHTWSSVFSAICVAPIGASGIVLRSIRCQPNPCMAGRAAAAALPRPAHPAAACALERCEKSPQTHAKRASRPQETGFRTDRAGTDRLERRRPRRRPGRPADVVFVADVRAAVARITRHGAGSQLVGRGPAVGVPAIYRNSARPEERTRFSSVSICWRNPAATGEAMRLVSSKGSCWRS